MITLVCGLTGTGKTTWVKEHMGDGVAYDLDAIAGAFRLRGPHEEYHDASRHMVNDILKAFSENAGRYTPSVYVIRTAPDDDEIEIIKPGHVVICMKQHVKRACSQGPGTDCKGWRSGARTPGRRWIMCLIERNGGEQDEHQREMRDCSGGRRIAIGDHRQHYFQNVKDTAPRGARPAHGGCRMKEQRKARGGIRRLIERNFEENIPAIKVVWESQIQSAGAAGERSPSNPSDHRKEEVQGRGKCSSIPRW